jgi:pyridoxal phosphate enzyme (YggS family)
MSAPGVDDIRAGLDRVRERIAAAGGDPERIRIVAVTKGFDAGVVSTALAAGVADIGENYAQELVAKWRAVRVPAAPPRVHFVGRLQRNKVRSLAGLVDVWQTVDRQSLGAEIARRVPGATVLVQVNVGDDPQKGGCRLDDLDDLVAGLADLDLDVVGLMAVAEQADMATVRDQFDRVRRAADRLALPERSMGMTADLEAAVDAGATMVRVGTALFGARPGR